MRFPEFKDEWKRRKLGEIATFFKGKGISKSDIEENGVNECIRYGELYTYYGEVIDEIKSKTNINTSSLVLSEANDVIIPASGETTVDIATASCVLKSGVALGSDLNIIKTDNNGVFLSYYLNSKKKMEIANLAQGISVVHLYSSQLATLSLCLPSIEEQTRISSLLALLDERIRTQNKIIEELKLLKSAIRYKLFQNINCFSPEAKCIKDVLEYEQPGKYIVDTETYHLNNSLIPVLTANKMFILGYTDEQNGIYRKGDCIIFDDFTMDMKFVDFPFKVKSSAIKILKPKQAINLRYVFEYLSFLNLKPAGHKRHYISEIEELPILIPKQKIQNEIANLFTQIDGKINNETNFQNQLSKQKEYLLSNLFI